MLGRWLQDIESLEEISRDDTTRALFLRLALLSQSGRLKPFLRELHADSELDADTKGSLAEVAKDESFLHAVEEYVRHTRAVH
ncbi:MAG: hypothetical protein ACXVZP_12685 [Gaiellaceae bacterium]